MQAFQVRIFYFSFKKELISYPTCRENANSLGHSAPYLTQRVHLFFGCTAPLGIPPALVLAGLRPQEQEEPCCLASLSERGFAHRFSFGRAAWRNRATHADLVFSGEQRARCWLCRAGQSAGLSHSHIRPRSRQQPQQEVAMSLMWGSSPQALPFRGCWAPCFAVKDNTLPGWLLPNFICLRLLLWTELSPLKDGLEY